mmetsp:Transcript_44392/g.105839  ORF Transcript_44392/g.105839 Transcript_44392/m.105839 type:complete len:496 (-) Transcript_44392:21-1508(-)
MPDRPDSHRPHRQLEAGHDAFPDREEEFVAFCDLHPVVLLEDFGEGIFAHEVFGGLDDRGPQPEVVAQPHCLAADESGDVEELHPRPELRYQLGAASVDGGSSSRERGHHQPCADMHPPPHRVHLATDGCAHPCVHLEDASGVVEARDHVVDAPLLRVVHPCHHLVAGGMEILEGLSAKPEPRICDWYTHGVDWRKILARDHLGEVPAEGAERAGKVVHLGEVVALVEHDLKLVFHPRESLGQAFQRLPGRARFVRVEEKQDHVRVFREPPRHRHEVVPPVEGVSHLMHPLCHPRPSSCGLGESFRRRESLPCRHRGAVDHAGRVDQDHVAHCQVLPHLELNVRDEGISEVAESHESQIRIAHQRRPVLVRVLDARSDEREGVVGGRDARLLHGRTHQVVDERRLPGGVVAQQEHHRSRRDDFALREGPHHALVDWEEDGLVALVSFLLERLDHRAPRRRPPAHPRSGRDRRGVDTGRRMRASLGRHRDSGGKYG